MKVKVEPYLSVKQEYPPFLPIKSERKLFPKSATSSRFTCLKLLDEIPLKRPVVKAPEIVEYFIHSKLKLKEENSRWNRTKLGKSSYTYHKPSKHEYRVIQIPKTRGKKPKVIKRWQLLCSHCDTLFFARPTPKNSRYVVNHQCKTLGNRRRQYIIGIKARNCTSSHTSPCIQHVECFNLGRTS